MKHYLQIYLDDSVDARTLNLDCYFFSTGQYRFMHLCNRSGGNGGICKVLENTANRTPQFLFDNLFSIFRGKRRDPILKLLQFGDKFVRYHIGSGAHNLTKFDKRWSKLLQNHPHPFPTRSRSYIRSTFP